MTRKFGLIGKKLGHSFSKKYFAKKFEDLKIDAVYDLHEIASISSFPDLVASIEGLEGLNVTIPYKSEVIPFLDELAPEAAAIGAVNVIKIDGEKRYGSNSDIFGFWVALQELLGGTEIEKALILGTGGAAKAVVYVLETFLKVDELKLVSRSPMAANHISYQDLHQIEIDNYRLVINTTPLGMYPDIEQSPYFPYEKLSDAHFMMDLIYNPDETSFMKLAAQYGAKTMNGMEMLIQQAEKAWEIWNA